MRVLNKFLQGFVIAFTLSVMTGMWIYWAFEGGVWSGYACVVCFVVAAIWWCATRSSGLEINVKYIFNWYGILILTLQMLPQALLIYILRGHFWWTISVLFFVGTALNYCARLARVGLLNKSLTDSVME